MRESVAVDWFIVIYTDMPLFLCLIIGYCFTYTIKQNIYTTHITLTLFTISNDFERLDKYPWDSRIVDSVPVVCCLDRIKNHLLEVNEKQLCPITNSVKSEKRKIDFDLCFHFERKWIQKQKLIYALKYKNCLS